MAFPVNHFGKQLVQLTQILKKFVSAITRCSSKIRKLNLCFLLGTQKLEVGKMLGTDSSDGRIIFFLNFESFEPVVLQNDSHAGDTCWSKLCKLRPKH